MTRSPSAILQMYHSDSKLLTRELSITSFYKLLSYYKVTYESIKCVVTHYFKWNSNNKKIPSTSTEYNFVRKVGHG